MYTCSIWQNEAKIVNLIRARRSKSGAVSFNVLEAGGPCTGPVKRLQRRPRAHRALLSDEAASRSIHAGVQGEVIINCLEDCPIAPRLSARSRCFVDWVRS